VNGDGKGSGQRGEKGGEQQNSGEGKVGRCDCKMGNWANEVLALGWPAGMNMDGLPVRLSCGRRPIGDWRRARAGVAVGWLLVGQVRYPSPLAADEQATNGGGAEQDGFVCVWMANLRVITAAGPMEKGGTGTWIWAVGFGSRTAGEKENS
jgi:hypothetical protein